MRSVTSSGRLREPEYLDRLTEPDRVIQFRVSWIDDAGKVQVNRGYRVIVPADCVAADPPEYGEQVLRYSIRNLAYVSTGGEIAAHWR